jgi:TldD protein
MLEQLDGEAILRQALSRGGDWADIFAERKQTTLVQLEAGKIEKISNGVTLGAGVRLVQNFRTAYAYANGLAGDTLLELARTVSRAGQDQGDRPQIRIAIQNWQAPVISPLRVPPEGVALSEKVAKLREADQAARAVDPRVRQVRVVYADQGREVAVINSRGFSGADRVTQTIFYVLVIAGEGDLLQTGYESHGGATGFEIFEARPVEDVAQCAAARAVRLLSARKIKGGPMAVVLHSEAGGTMIHEAIGHGLEADLATEGLSVYSGKIGETVASPLITVLDDATLPGRRGSFGMDDEGTPSERTVLVERGILKGYLMDRLRASKTGGKSTGNGRRESYRHLPVVRMSNTMIAPGSADPEEIIRSVSQGLLVKRMGGGQVNTVNGDFVFDVEEGYLIEGGRVSEPVRGATLTGNGPEILKQIDLVGSDLGFGLGTCGKDGQGVPVADAQPTLRIPEIIVGGEG